MNKSHRISPQNTEIDIHPLWLIFRKRIRLILTITLISFFCSVFYIWKSIPIYQGTALIEVGEVINHTQIIDNSHIVKNTITSLKLDENINDLKEITTHTTRIRIKIPNGSSNILELSTENSNPENIKFELENAVQFILNRHKEKAHFYENNVSKIRMTKLIGEIRVDYEPIKPKKQLIIAIALIIGLILGLFLALLKEFILIKHND